MEHVWRPGQIGPLQLDHRLVMGSMHLGLEGIDPDGRMLAEFYRRRVAGGCGLVVTGGSAVSEVGAGGRNYSFVNDASQGPKLARIPEAVHAEGGRVLLQLFHAGRYASERYFGLQPIAPSAVYSKLSRSEPRALEADEIADVVEQFATGAARALELGFDGVEIMGSEGYLLNQFMAPATNHRDDYWGGTLEGRMRLPLAVASAVRDVGGERTDGFAVVYRMSGVDLVEDGTPADDVLALASRLASGPVDALNVGIGWHEARVPTVQALVPKGAWAPWARRIREVVDVPVIASNRVNTVAVAERLLAGGDCDFISMARPLLADPDLVSRSRSGRRVNVCIACNACIEQAILDRRVSCVVNPRAGYELETTTHDRVGATAGARVAVIGGGPAGMEAARALAVAGFTVTLFEASDRIGGQFRMASRIPGKEDFGTTIAFYEEELTSLGVSIEAGADVVAADALSGFDAAVVATGVVPRTVSIPGAELPHVVSYAELLSAENPAAMVGGADRAVAIIGGGGIGVDVAHLLAVRDGAEGAARSFYARYGLDDGGGELGWSGRPVTLMRRSGRIGDGVTSVTRWAVVQELAMAGVAMLTGVDYLKIDAGSVLVRGSDGAARSVSAATVVIAAGQEPRGAALVSSLTAAGLPHVVIGGADDAAGLDAGRAFRAGLDAPDAVAVLLGAAA